MKPPIKVGDKVIGLTNRYSEPHVGTVLLTDLHSFDPLHDLLVNVTDEPISLSSVAEYKSRLQELSKRTCFLSSREALLYSPDAEKQLRSLYAFLNSKRGKKAVNYELEMQDFFEKGKNVFLLKVRVYSKLCAAFVARHAANVSLGTIELFLGDIWRFYESRLEIRKLKQQIGTETTDMRRSRAMSRMMGNNEDDAARTYLERIEKIQIQLATVKSEKTEISRAFIAVMISVASLIVSIIALHSK